MKITIIISIIIIIIIIIMKNFNRRGHGHHGPKHRKLAKHAHSRGSHAFIHTLASTQHVVRNASSAITEFGIECLF